MNLLVYKIKVMKPITTAPNWATIILSITWIIDCINPENSVPPDPPVNAFTTWFNVSSKALYNLATGSTDLLIVGNQYVDPMSITALVGS